MVKNIDKAIGEAKARSSPEPEKGKKSQATRLVEMALGAKIEPFHTPSGDAYATVPVGEHLETHSLGSTAFRNWLRRLYYRDTGSSPGNQAVEDALGVLRGKALFDGKESPV